MQEKNAEKKKLTFDRALYTRVFLFVLYDIAALMLSDFLTLFVRFDFSIPKMEISYLMSALNFLPLTTVFMLIIFTIFHLYTSLWIYASEREMFYVVVASLIVGLSHFAL